jgi:hypothetical protein
MKLQHIAGGAGALLFAALSLGAGGRPDFSGYWVDAQRAGALHIAASAVNPAGYSAKPIAHSEIEDIEGSAASVARRLANADLRPAYKLPEHAAKARKNFEEVNFVDPAGVARRREYRASARPPRSCRRSRRFIFSIHCTTSIG